MDTVVQRECLELGLKGQSLRPDLATLISQLSAVIKTSTEQGGMSADHATHSRKEDSLVAYTMSMHHITKHNLVIYA